MKAKAAKVIAVMVDPLTKRVEVMGAYNHRMVAEKALKSFRERGLKCWVARSLKG